MGGGGTGVSTGAGPFTLYESVGRSSAQRPTPAPRGLTPAQAQRHQQVEAARQQFALLENLHRAEFVGPDREVVVRPALPKFGRLLLTAEKQSLRGIRLVDRNARKAARVAARGQAERWAIDLIYLAEADRKARQDEIDRHWADLHGNDPNTVGSALSAAFASRAGRVRLAGVVDDEARLLVTIPGPDVVPDSKPALTRSGAPTLHKVNKTDRAAWHRQVAASEMLLAAKQALAVAPGLVGVRVIAVDAVGTPLVAARLNRAGLSEVDWRSDAWRILGQIDSEIRCDARGRTGELRTIDLRDDDRFGALLTPSS